MLAWMPSFVRGALALALLVANMLAGCGLLFVLALVKLALPLAPVRRRVDPALNAIATAWIACNGVIRSPSRSTPWAGSSARCWT